MKTNAETGQRAARFGPAAWQNTSDPGGRSCLDPANNPKIISWTKQYWEALHPYSPGGAYVNFMMDEGEDRIKATYRNNYDRLAAVKKKCDPANFFHVNQNIRPGAWQYGMIPHHDPPVDSLASGR